MISTALKSTTMKLAEWIKAKGLTRARFAEMIEVSPGMVTVYCDGSSWPSRAAAKRISEVTGGEVTPNDFLDAPQAAE